MPERARGGPVAFAVRPVTCRTVIAEDLGAVHGKSNLPVLAGKNQWENAAEEQFARYRDLRNVSPGCSALNIGESTPFSCLFVCELQQHLKRAGGAAIAHFLQGGMRTGMSLILEERRITAANHAVARHLFRIELYRAEQQVLGESARVRHCFVPRTDNVIFRLAIQ
jgi:hypothetical protein